MSINEKKPNILLITTDQHHWTMLGKNNSKLKTPNLDRLAEEGIICDRAYCPNPTCTPSRASIITGNYPSQHGAWSLGTKLLDDVPTLGKELQKLNYKTGLVGKAHFEPLKSTDEFKSLESYPTLQDSEFWKTFTGPYYGFDFINLARNHTFEAHVGEHYKLWLEEQGCENWQDYFCKPTGNKTKLNLLRQDNLWEIPEKYHYNTWIAETSNKKLMEYKKENENFFLWASFFDPHGPKVLPEPWNSMYDPEDMDAFGPIEGEHKKNPPHFQLSQLDSTVSGRYKKIKKIFKKIKKSKKKVKFQNYYEDYKRYGLKRQGIHGLHTHLYNKEKIKHSNSAYYGMVSLLDKYIGKILDQLEQSGLKDNTIVVFTTDHGDFMGQHGLITKGPYLYEDLLRIPFIVRYPNHIPKNKHVNSLQSLIDLAPTFLSYLDLEIPPHMAGKDQSKVWEGKEEHIRDHILCEMHHTPDIINIKSYVNQTHKITVYNNQTYGELFDLQKDKSEINNLWDDNNSKQLKNNLLMNFIQAELEKDKNYTS